MYIFKKKITERSFYQKHQGCELETLPRTGWRLQRGRPAASACAVPVLEGV